jgi:hypothetical protein
MKLRLFAEGMNVEICKCENVKMLARRSFSGGGCACTAALEIHRISFAPLLNRDMENHPVWP